jgi:hypothetical protein
MPLGRDKVMLQEAVHIDIKRKLIALSERMGIRPSAVVALAISEMAEARGIVLKQEVDPRQITMFPDEEAA